MTPAEEKAYDDGRQLGLVHGRRQAEGLVEKVEAVRKAVADAGPVPSHHRSVLDCHRREWPTLWRALDALVGRPW